MSDLYWLTDEQMARLAPYFPKSHGNLPMQSTVDSYTGCLVNQNHISVLRIDCRLEWL